MLSGLNTSIQHYKSIPIKLIKRGYGHYKAKRFALNGTNQNVWIPNKHLLEDGTLKDNENIDYVFKKSWNQCRIAGIDLNVLYEAWGYPWEGKK